MFLLRDRSLTLIYLAFTIVLVVLCTSLPTMKGDVVQIDAMISDVGMVING